MERIEKARNLLRSYTDKQYKYLGNGFSGVVFHDGDFVYKVHIPLSGNRFSESDGLHFLGEKKNDFKDSKYLYEFDFFDIEGITVMKYPYEEGTAVGRIGADEFIGFLSECWERKLIFKSITKEKNFIRVKGNLKFIDYEIVPFTDNLFLNMAARAFMYIAFPYLSEMDYNRLKRSIINNFKIDEMKGFDRFLGKLFHTISFNDYYWPLYDKEQFIDERLLWISIKNGEYIERINVDLHTDDQSNIHLIQPFSKKLNDNNLKVSLMIKACPQDSKTIYQQVKHIIKQLSSPDIFLEKIIVIDKKEKDFLREFTSNGSLEELYNEVRKLFQEEIIDNCIVLNEDETGQINRRWFGIETQETHTVTNIPVTPQLNGFEKAKGDYILQMDCDVLVGRKDHSHSFLSDMIRSLEENPNAVSVGFNIPKKPEIDFLKYHAPDGGYKPEVRMGLLHRKRILDSLPWNNELVDGKLKYSWYQALHRHQRRNGLVSLRGGDPRSFYIHPQNYRKTCFYNMSIITDRVEKNVIPDVQLEKYDLEGSLYDWSIPKRNESVVSICIVDDTVDIGKVHRFLSSFDYQNFNDKGLIIINNDQNQMKDKAINSMISGNKNVTYIHNKFKFNHTECIFIGIHYFIENPETLIVISDANGYFLGSDIFGEIYHRMNIYNSDVMIGKELNTLELNENGLFHVDFINTRNPNSNLDKYLKVFKKKIFDSISLYDLKKETEPKIRQNIFEKLSSRSRWIKDERSICTAAMAVELGKNPIRFDHFNFVIDKEEDVSIIESLKEIDHVPLKESGNIIENGRIDFLTNLRRIEIDITYRCNLNCKGCNRSCSQVKGNNDDMKIEQINNFIDQSKELGIKWEMISILGGEPTLHPDFKKIIETIQYEYVEVFSPETIVQIVSNGYTTESRELLYQVEEMNNVIIDRHSFKKSNKIDYFTPFNIAPIDLEEMKDLEYRKGCWVTSFCGMGLNKFGYYPCAVAGAIDRIEGANLGIKDLKNVDKDQMKTLLDHFCKYCGNMVDYDVNMGNFIPRCEKRPFKKNSISKSWKKLYDNYKKSHPKLTDIYPDLED